MPRCIFCLADKSNLTDEHVFPAALGGALVLKDSVCAECNNGFSKFEQPFVGELAPLRLLLRIPDRYGEVPVVPAVIKVGEAEYQGRVNKDGSVTAKPIVSVVTKADGKKEIVYQFVTQRQRERLREEARQKGEELIETGPGDPQTGEVQVGGELKIIGSDAGLRAVSKIAYVGLAFKAGLTIATSESFNEARSYILTGKGTPTSRLFVHERYLNMVQQGPHQHSLTIAARRDKRCVDAIVRIFGGLCYFVKLSDHYEGADFVDTLVFDAQNQEISGVLQTNIQAEILQIEDVATSRDTKWDDLVASGMYFGTFLDNAITNVLRRRQAK